MKSRDLIRELEKLGCIFIRHGAKHDWYQNPETKKDRCHVYQKSVFSVIVQSFVSLSAF